MQLQALPATCAKFLWNTIQRLAFCAQVIAEMRGYSVTCIDRAQALKHYAPLSANAVAVGSDSAAVAGGVAALKKEPKAVVCGPASSPEAQ